MTTNNSAVVKIIAKHTEQYNKLSDKYKTLMEVHLKTLKALDNLTGKYEEQRREIVEDLKAIETRRLFGKDEALYDIIIKILDKWEGKK